MITYRKTKQDEWVAFAPVAEVARVKVGDTVTVSKKDKTTEARQVARAGNPFPVDGVPHVYLYLIPKQGGGRPAPSRGTSRSGRCRERGCGNDANENAPHCRAMDGYCGWCAYDNI